MSCVDSVEQKDGCCAHGEPDETDPADGAESHLAKQLRYGAPWQLPQPSEDETTNGADRE